MPSIIDHQEDAPLKLLLIGKSGAGKTGSLASLVTAGYNLRAVDTDKGMASLRSLLTHPGYPYARLIRERNIDLRNAVRYVPIDTSMKLRQVTRQISQGKTTTETLLAPVDAKAWPRAVELLAHWKDEDTDFGPVTTWGIKDVLVIDSFSTLAKCAYYFSQAMNSRLGARDEGFDYQRDIGAAQSQLTRLLELLYDSSVKCNVIVISHITWVDESSGVAGRPRESTDGTISMPDGYPSAIGRALSPHMGKYFNDVYIVRASGSGSVSRNICTVPRDGVVAKNSIYLEREYSVQSGLAEIFAAAHNTPADPKLIEALRARPAAPAAPLKPGQTSPAPAPASRPPAQH